MDSLGTQERTLSPSILALGDVDEAAAGRFVPPVARWFCRPASMGGKWGPRPGPRRHPPNPRFSPAGTGLAPRMRGTASLVTREGSLTGQALASPHFPFHIHKASLDLLRRDLSPGFEVRGDDETIRPPSV